MLKKRLETAYEIRQDLKYMLKEQEFKFRDNEQAKIKISRIEPYLAQYWQNCRVKGLPEIDAIIESVDFSKGVFEEIKQKLGLLSDKETQQEIEPVTLINEVKNLYG